MLEGLDDRTGSTSSEAVAAPPPPSERDETMERAPVRPALRDSGAWTISSLAAPPDPAIPDDWVVTTVATAARARAVTHTETGHGADSGDDGTPLEGVVAIAPVLPMVGGSFVAGEIDVPTPPPELDKPSEPDTGAHTPPLERR